MKHKISVIFLVLLLVGLLSTYFFHQTVDVSEIENRTMANFSMIFNPPEKDSIIYKENPVDRFEEALKDQFMLRNEVVTSYSGFKSYLSNVYSDFFFSIVKIIDRIAPEKPEDNLQQDISDFEKYPTYGRPILKTFPSQLYTLKSIGPYFRINDTDYIGEMPAKSQLKSEDVQIHIDQFSALMKAYPELKIYNYFISQSRDTPWFDKYLGITTADRFEFVAQMMPESIVFDRLVYSDFDDYAKCNFKSDHHWNHNGARRGYEDVYEMLKKDGRIHLSELKTPLKEWNFSELYGVEYKGSRAKKLTDFYDAYDEFISYEYDLGQRDTYVVDINTFEEIPAKHGLWDSYKKGEINKEKYIDHYVIFYGTAFDETGKKYSDSKYMFKIDNKDSVNNNKLLLVGDSTQRAYRDVIASHFSTTVFLDYRIMSKVNVDELIEKYDIDTLLVGGLIALWNGDTYMFSFSENFNK